MFELTVEFPLSVCLFDIIDRLFIRLNIRKQIFDCVHDRLLDRGRTPVRFVKRLLQNGHEVQEIYVWQLGFL